MQKKKEPIVMTQGLAGIGRLLALTLLLAWLLPGSANAVFMTLPHPVPLRAESLDLLRAIDAEDSDQWKLVVFGFTRCKDICPRTIGNLSRLVKLANEKKIQMDGVFVTIDPDRDTDPVLGRYTAPYGQKISFLRLRDEALERFKDQFGVEAIFYTKNKGNEFHYQVDHSSMAFLIDPKGRIRVVFDALEDSDSLAQMLREDQIFFQ